MVLHKELAALRVVRDDHAEGGCDRTAVDSVGTFASGQANKFCIKQRDCTIKWFILPATLPCLAYTALAGHNRTERSTSTRRLRLRSSVCKNNG